MKYPHIFQPIRVGDMVFKNRIWSAPGGVHLLYGREEYPSEAAMAYYFEKARGGAACITYSAQNMDFEQPYDAVHANENILHPESHRFFGELTDGVHAAGAKISLELLAFSYHGHDHQGRRITYSVNGGPQWNGAPTVKLHREAMESIAQTYADTAEAALTCGFDMIQIHAGHGLCISQFLSKAVNRRTDEFGGSTENRVRFLKLLLDAVRARVGNKLLIELRISGDEMFADKNKGYHVEDCIEMLRLVQDQIDLVQVSNGMFYSGTAHITHPTEFLPEGVNSYLARAVKSCPDIHIPVITIGAFTHPDKIEQALSDGTADIVAMTRGLISDAGRVNKWRDGLEDECIPCLRCLHCLDYGRSATFRCSVNPRVGRESRLPYISQPARAAKRVIVIGGGPAGMQAALQAQARDHEVTLIERQDRLGGKLLFSRQVSFKGPLAEFLDYLVHMVEKRGIRVLLNTEATPELVASLRPDAVIAALGAQAALPPIPGVDLPHVITAEEAYAAAAEGRDLGRILILGGGQVGAETALHLALDKGYAGRVTVVEQAKEIAAAEPRHPRSALLEHLRGRAELLTETVCTAITDAGAEIVQPDGTKRTLPADTIILAAGMRPRIGEAMAFAGAAPQWIQIGDCRSAANVCQAVHDGFDAANQIG